MSAQDTFFYQKIERIFDVNASPLIMGILNVTPDSFFDGGKYTTGQAWLEKTGSMIEAGADIIDIGAYSTRPGAEEVSESDEADRLIKVIVSVREKFPEIVISVDTFRASVAEKAVASGANIINDISGGTVDDQMFEVVAKLNVPYILMHMKGTPKTMQADPVYKDVTKEVFNFFKAQLEKLKKLNVEKVILDPGFGFGKTVEHNFQLLKDLPDFNELNCPILAGMSRKSMINKLLNISSKDALNGTSVLNTIALEKGAKILRVHDVKEANEVRKLIGYLMSL